ncbi:hypothetical protein, partial [Methylophilus sp.]|uniref:hypothetical protein n=1 Tax=Methylophilus sp. TaxID=29541 RepID=UPI0040382307
VLAGAWSTTSELDKEILKDLSQKSTYDEYESNLRPLLLLEDPPIDRVKDTWATRSQADAFYFIHQLMGNKEQELFKQSVLKVLGAEAAELDPEAPFSSAPDPAKSYSTWLKNGLANMLLQIVSISEDGGFSVIGASNQAFVDSIIQALPGWGRRHETIVAISEQLATIAEASPNSFLDALESLLEGESKEVSALFNDSDKSIFAKTSPHTYLLWALELLAWDPKHLTKVCELLMRLASIDPGGSTSNRPINSLKEILLPWSPNTYAECAHRLDCLDQLIKINAELGWELLIKLIPSNHDTSFPTQKPRLRDVTPRKPEVLTNAIVWKAQGHIVNRAIELAATSESRLTSLIGYISNFGPDERNKSLSTINTFLEQNTSTRESSVWSKLRDEVKRQEFFRTADWALEDSELQKFKTVVEIHQPKDPLIKYTWLFDDWMPHVGKFEDQLEEKTESSRIEAVLTIFEHSGVRGIYDLISRTKIKHLVIETLAKCDFSIEIYTQLAPYLLNDEEPSLEAISTLSAVASVKFGEAWTRYVSLILQLPSMIQSIRTSLVINWAQNQKTWDFIESLGPEDEMAYWTSLNHLPVTGSKEDLDTAIQKFLNYGKAYQVIYSLYNRTPEVETQKILQILGTAISEINSNPKLLNHMFSYYLEKILSNLRLRPELKLEDLAKIEFAYINALDHDIKDLSIHRYIAENPNFYMELISNVFVADGEEPPESTPATKSQATASFNVLNTLKTLPGQSGDHVNFEHLENWITEVRSIALLKKRVDITDQYIGHILAHSPIDDSDQLWPHKSVRIVIENLRNEWIENGIAIERFNMRGVFSRGHYEGGIQELNIADRYRNWSDSMVGFSRTKGLLNRLYDEWVGHAGDADIRAEKNKLKS